MAFLKKLWKNEPSTDTPLNATGLNDLETRVETALAAITAASINAAPLVDGLIPDEYYSNLVLGDVFVVNSQAEMLALSTAQRGDFALRTDENKNYVLKSGSPATLSNWQGFLFPGSGVTSVAGKSGTVILVASDISDFATAVPTSPAAGTPGLRALGTTSLTAAAGNDPRLGGVPSRTQSSSFTIAESDRGMAIEMTNTGAATVTVPQTLSEGFTCVVRRYGAGSVTFAEDTSAFVNSKGGRISSAGKKTIADRFTSATLRYTAAPDWTPAAWASASYGIER